jgi:hypothetical protein
MPVAVEVGRTTVAVVQVEPGALAVVVQAVDPVEQTVQQVQPTEVPAVVPGAAGLLKVPVAQVGLE